MIGAPVAAIRWLQLSSVVYSETNESRIVDLRSYPQQHCARIDGQANGPLMALETWRSNGDGSLVLVMYLVDDYTDIIDYSRELRP